MSSDSELDEFFDAEDVTPKVSFLDNIPENDATKVSNELEEEERRLQELKRLQEERRKKEDEEYQNMLLDLKAKKEKQKVLDDTMIENEKRRKRLEEMRKRMADEDNSPQYADDVKNRESYKHESDTDDELLDDSDSSNGKSPRFSQVDSQTTIAPKNNEVNFNISNFCPEKEKPNKQIPELKTEDFSDDKQDIEITVDSVLSESKIDICTDTDEPDIIKSTKTKTPPSTLSAGSVEKLHLPVAPPRRKKKGEVTNDEMCSEASTPDWDMRSPGLPAPTPTSTVESITKELEHALDLRSALGGGRHINAEDAEKDAVNSDQDSPRQQDSLDKDVAPLAEGLVNDENKTGSLRPRSNSGRLLTDEEILETISILNLDTGEKVPLSAADEKIPNGLNPLTLHIMQRTQEYHSDGSLKEGVPDEMDSEDTKSLSEASGAKKKGSRFKKMIGKKVGKTMNRVKNVADQMMRGDDAPVEEETVSVDGKIFKIKNSNNNKGPYDFKQIQMLQDLSGVHTGAIWTMKFSPCGRLLATGGQDMILRIWVLRSASGHFDDLRQKYADVRVSPAPSQESLNSSDNSADLLASGGSQEELSPFMPKPFCTYRGHTADLLDISWSKNCFILSSSMDKTVRLWHISRRECLCTFQHIDFVTAIVFHPRDDRYFLSGSLDKKLRLWNIPEKKVTMWNEASNLITTANFCHNGKFAVAGTYDGKCIFYSTEQLKYYTQIHVRSTRGKNARGRKITGIEPLPGEDKVLVTSNDSRIRMYDLRDLTLTCKYKGGTNNSSQIKASFSGKAKYIICGSEDHFVYIWKTQHEYFKFSSARRDRNDYWEAVKVHNAVVTAAVFVPIPSLLLPNEEGNSSSCNKSADDKGNQVLVTADFSGAIKVIQNKIC